MARYTHFSAAASVGKWPRALTALRIRALMDSMAFVVQTTARMWGVELQERDKLRPRGLPQFDDRRVSIAPRLGERDERIEGGRFARRGVDRFEILGQRRPVLLRGVAEAVAEQVHVIPTSE